MTSILIVLSFVLFLFLSILSPWFLLTSVLLGWYIFRDSMNLVQRAGRVYWIIRDTGKKGVPFVAKAYMISVSSPWLTGHGVQFRIGKYTFQIGLCKELTEVPEQDGILRAVDGHYMESAPKEIGTWR